MNPKAKAQGLPPQLRFQYIHPVDLMETRLRNALQDSAPLIDVCLEMYQLDYCQTDAGCMATTKLRPDAYCDPYEKFERPAWHSLKRAMPCAIGINEWLRWGMPARAGAFETEVRMVLSDMHSWVSHVRNLAFYPALKDRRVCWEQNIAKGWDLLRELQHVAVESRDPAEWYGSLREMLKRVKTLHEACYDYYEAAKDVQADVTAQFNAIETALDPVIDQLARLGPRLCYAYNDREDVDSLVEALPEWFSQCLGNLPTWRLHLPSSQQEQDCLARKPPAILREAWDPLIRLGDVVYDLLQSEPDQMSPGSSTGPPRRSSVSIGPTDTVDIVIRKHGKDWATIQELSDWSLLSENAIYSRIQRWAKRTETSSNDFRQNLRDRSSRTAKHLYRIRAVWHLLASRPETSRET